MKWGIRLLVVAVFLVVAAWVVAFVAAGVLGITGLWMSFAEAAYEGPDWYGFACTHVLASGALAVACGILGVVPAVGVTCAFIKFIKAFRRKG